MLRPFALSCTLSTALVVVLLAGCGTTRLDRSATLYSYVRTVMPGMVPDRSKPSDRMSGEPAERAIENYFIYLSKPNSTVSVVTIWIRGKAYNATGQEIYQLPIVLESGGPGIFKISDTLVPAGIAPVWRILPGEMKTARTPRILRRKGQKPEVVVDFISNGKHLLALSNQFKKLTPIVLE